MGKLKIIRVPIDTPTLFPHTTTNCYLIGNEKEAVLVDAGYDRIETRQQLEAALQEYQLAVPKAIILTHYHLDHAPGVLQLLHWQGKIYCHPSEEKAIIKEVNKELDLHFLNDGDRLAIDGEEIVIQHGPGHTKGHLNIYIPREKILLSGDNLVAEGTSWIGPPDGNMADYLDTLSEMRKLELVKVGPGHGAWIDKPYEHIDFVRGRRLQREQEILDILKNGSFSSRELTKAIYKDSIHPTIFEVARSTTLAHLEKLIGENKVTQEKEDYFSLVIR